MSERIRSLLRRVAAAGDSSEPGDARLKEVVTQRSPCERSLQSLEREVASEIAYSLGRAGTKLEAALAKLTATQAELEAAPGPGRRALVVRFNDERLEAERRLRDLLIQREAIGLRQHADVRKRYVIPPPLFDES